MFARSPSLFHNPGCRFPLIGETVVAVAVLAVKHGARCWPTISGRRINTNDPPLHALSSK